MLVGDAPQTPNATATTGMAVSFTAGPSNVCAISGNTVTAKGAGTCIITASQPGSDFVDAAPSITKNMPVKLAQTITFAPIADHALGSPPFAISAAATSGLPVAFSVPSTSSVCSVTNATVTLLSVGTCSIVALVSGSSPTYDNAPSFTRSFNVTKTEQTIVFGALADVALSRGPFTIDAIASSGLPVSFNSTTPVVCSVSGKTVSPLSIGACVIVASQAGNSTYVAAAVSQTFHVVASAVPSVSAVQNAASYQPGELAANSYAVVFGANLAASTGDPSTTVTIQDASGQSFPAAIIFASSQQVNILMPANVALGPATLTLSDNAGTSTAFAITIGPIAPGLFTVDASARMPAAQVVIAAQDGSQTFQLAANCGTTGTCSLLPIPLDPSTQVYLILYGTGIRGRTSLTGVSLTIGGVPAAVSYAGSQGGFPGLDQINVLIPASLAGRGRVEVQVTVDGRLANAVDVMIQ